MQCFLHKLAGHFKTGSNAGDTTLEGTEAHLRGRKGLAGLLLYSFVRRIDSVLTIKSAAATLSTWQILNRTTMFGLWTPRSTKLMNDRSNPAASASFSCDIAFAFRNSCKALPKAHLGPEVG